MKTAFISGICGFVGSHLAIELVKNGLNVIGIDITKDTKNPELKRLIEKGKVKIYNGDLIDYDFKNIPNADYVYHTASKVTYWGNEEEFNRINANGTKKVIDYAIRSKSKVFLYFSSTAVYGFAGYINRKEEDEKKPFNNPYCLSKLKAEELVKEFCPKNNINYIIIRPGNVFGPYDFTSSFEVYKHIKKGKLPLIDGGRYKNCFVYVENLAKGAYKASITENAYNKDYNITDGTEFTLRDYVKCVENNIRPLKTQKSYPRFLAKPTAIVCETLFKLLKSKKAPLISKFVVYQHAKDYHFTIEKAKQSFGYEPVVKIEEAIKKTCDWFNKEFENWSKCS